MQGHVVVHGTVPAGQTLLVKVTPRADSPQEIKINITFSAIHLSYNATLELVTFDTADYSPEGYDLLKVWTGGGQGLASPTKFGGFTFALDNLSMTDSIAYNLDLIPISSTQFHLAIFLTPYYRSSITFAGFMLLLFGGVTPMTLFAEQREKENGMFKYQWKDRKLMIILGLISTGELIIFGTLLIVLFGPILVP